MQVREDNIRTRRARAGGPLLDLGIYCVNAARYLFRAEPVAVTALAASKKGDARFREVHEQIGALLRFPGDRLAQMTCSFGAYDHSSLVAVGEKGRLRLEPAYDYATDLALEVEVEGRKPSRKVFAKRDQVAAELVAFAGYVRDDVEPEPSGAEGVADLRVLDAITRSLQSGRAEPVTTEAGGRRRRPSKRQSIRRPPHDMPDLVHASPPGRS
jgi:predicted dehydrogenase